MIDNPIIERATQILAASPHILLPINELYDALMSEGLMAWVPENTFEALIAADQRFEILESLGSPDLLEPEVWGELIAYGLIEGPLVMLRNRAATPDIVIRGVLYHLQNMNEALETAWRMRLRDDPYVESELIGLLMMGDMLERRLKQALDIDHVPEPSHHASNNHKHEVNNNG